MENNEKQQLELIAEMISTARREFNDNGFIYLVWGWAVCIAGISEFILMRSGGGYSGFAWLVLMPLAAIAQMIFMQRRKKAERVRSLTDKTMGYIWTAVGASLAAVLFSSNTLQLGTYPVIILLYGIGTFISGGVLRLMPMKAGAICCWVLGFIAFRVGLEYQLLLLSLSVILSYIIPGYILKNRYRQNV